MKNKLLFLFGILFLMSCTTSKPRRPINPKPSTTIFQDNIEATKKIFELEESEILEFIKKDTTKLYETSSSGFWYTYNTKIEEKLAMPKTGDVVRFEYDIKDLNDSVLYSKAILGVKNYKVDKEDFISGIQKGIKLMKIGETITFVIPSYNAFGISGDGNKIGINKTIKSTVTLLNIN
ncbi:gliding motility-associated peptidyl-prolyl isomerase GldI [Polaribacter sp. ALD11]|uniref:gliding motility-associated peptidyl-prolyl isomerase GldI n=1 Tax=Polaribacter sp. ALD11 TaxID=2058137 RepID=UPI000C30CFC9|nr:gliding motility-associated peptidyl-prolyl isomerase GldI [Polaribacter sp. ALD11]AUC84484.1 gliding motility-associated peptidyl-prolyl isomerase GldI [Polaribacter sp. ALD11]